jgi:hypothetical protein
MGRGRRRQRYRDLNLPQDRFDVRKISDSTTFIDFVRDDGVSGYYALQLDLVTWNENDELEIDREKVKRGIDSLKTEVISAREYDRETFIGYTKEATGLRGERAAVNAANREYAAKTRLLLTAAKVSGVEVTPADKRVLNPVSEGRFFETVYGKQGQFENGTLATRTKSRKATGRYRDPSVRARAEDRLQYLKGQEWREYVA